MSLLNELRKKRSLLKPTKTLITTQTGECYLRSHQGREIIKLEQHSQGFVVDTKPDLQPACILQDFLYLGSQDSVNQENIINYHLTHILSIGVNIPDTIALEGNVERLYIPCLDIPETVLSNILSKAYEFINQCLSLNGRILIHCNAGISRSASVVIGYLIQHRQMDYQEAYDLVKLNRPCIQPNSGFLKQLKLLRCLH